MKQLPFHLSLPCKSISATSDFYVNILGAVRGRYTTNWLDINLHGNQITFTKSGDFNFIFKSYKFEDTVLPSFHFGVIVEQDLWKTLFNKLQGSDYEVTNDLRFLRDKKGEHKSFFVKDPNGYMVEFKCFIKPRQIFTP